MCFRISSTGRVLLMLLFSRGRTCRLTGARVAPPPTSSVRYASATGLFPASLESLALLSPANCSQVRFWPALPAPHRAKLLVDVDGPRAFALPLEDRVQILGSHVLAHAVWARQRTRAQLRTSAGRALSQTSNGVALFRCEINKRPSCLNLGWSSSPPPPPNFNVAKASRGSLWT